MNMSFVLGKVFIGTEKQRAVGIYGTFNMDITTSDGVVISVSDMKLCKSKEGQWYIQSPYREYEKKDQQGNTTKGKQYYVKFWPEEKNSDKKNALIEQVKREIEAIAKGGQPKQQAPAPRPAPVAKNSDPW